MSKIDKTLCQSFIDRFDEKLLSVVIKQMITPAQCRAARGLLGWTQKELATRAGVGVVTVRQFEGGSSPRRATMDVIRRALEFAEVEFIEENGGGPGVRLRKSLRPKRSK